MRCRIPMYTHCYRYVSVVHIGIFITNEHMLKIEASRFCLMEPNLSKRKQWKANRAKQKKATECNSVLKRGGGDIKGRINLQTRCRNRPRGNCRIHIPYIRVLIQFPVLLSPLLYQVKTVSFISFSPKIARRKQDLENDVYVATVVSSSITSRLDNFSACRWATFIYLFPSNWEKCKKKELQKVLSNGTICDS